MRQQFASEALQSTEGVYRDLVSASLSRVDFEELAEEVIRANSEGQ
jgi:hypothetical protein